MPRVTELLNQIVEWVQQTLGSFRFINQIQYFQSDANHQRCVDILPRLLAPLLTTWSYFTEAMYLLGRMVDGLHSRSYGAMLLIRFFCCTTIM